MERTTDKARVWNQSPGPAAAGEGSGPRVVIIGGGFAGLLCAQGLARSKCQITLLDRRNHHVFQPLLYQVATAGLSPAQIASPIRRVLASQRNCRVLMAEVTSIDAPGRRVVLSDGELAYDYLVIATGVTHSYFGHEDWADLAPGLKCLEDATEIRRRFLLAFERAERETDLAARRASMTFVVIGGGPTGVEMAGAFAEIARQTIAKDFRAISTSGARVMLIEANERVLMAYAPALGERAKRDLEELGVQVMTHSRVVEIDAHGVMVETTPAESLPPGTKPPSLRVESECVVWAAGVKASNLGTIVAASAGAEVDRAGRVKVNADLSVGSHPEIFVCGDLASVMQRDGTTPVPGVAPGAMQMGKHASKIIASEIKSGVWKSRVAATSAAGGAPQAGGPPERQSFVYVNKGEMATIGRARAVGVIGFGLNVPLTGFIAWALWALIHISYLIGFRNRVLVLIDWVWSYVFFERGARLITGERAPAVEPSSNA
ncbi:MAG: NAD(P)/FAD-dependent oxidoreductase [Phycisphaerales bacterium]|nr:NAD(P)/FAD-dependent oxidoreductase [Phycisphaerales bacterium]